MPLIIPDVGIFRFVAELGRKLRITGMNPRNIAGQKRIITRTPNRRRPCDYLEETRAVTHGGSANGTHHSISGGGGVAFLLVNGGDRHSDLGRCEEEVGNAAA